MAVPASEIRSEDMSLIRTSERSFLLNINTAGQTEAWYDLTAEPRPRSQLLWRLDVAGRPIKTTGHEDLESETVYTDVRKGSTVVIREREGTGRYSVSGLLGGDLVIRPHSYWSQAATCRACLPVTWHNLTRLDTSTASTDYEALPDSLNVTRGREGRQYNSGTVYPEILIVVDYSLHERFDFSLAATRSYVISYFNTVNFR